MSMNRLLAMVTLFFGPACAEPDFNAGPLQDRMLAFCYTRELNDETRAALFEHLDDLFSERVREGVVKETTRKELVLTVANLRNTPCPGLPKTAAALIKWTLP